MVISSFTNALRASLRPPSAPAGRPRPLAQVLLEAAAFGVLAPALVLVLVPQPLREPAAALLVLCPLVLGLKHGLGAGAWGAALTAAAMAFAWRWVADDMASYPKASAIAGLLVGLVAGSARERSDSRLNQLAAQVDYHRARLLRQSAEHDVLLLSHAELERKLATQCSLRTSLERVRREIEQVLGTDATENRRLGARMLDILRDVGQLHAAAVFLCLDDGKLPDTAAATTGSAAPLLTAYPGVATRLDATAEALTAEALAPDAPPVVVALRDFSGRLRGALVVEEMAFDAVCLQTFERLQVLARTLANALARRARPVDGARDLRQMRGELRQAIAEARHTSLPLAMAACDCPAGIDPDVFVQRMVQAGRCLDRSWVVRQPRGGTTVLKLLPLTDATGAQAFASRMECRLHEESPGLRLELHTWAFMPGEADRPGHGTVAALDALDARAQHDSGGTP